MIVVLDSLMAGAFDDLFTNIGDVFERALAKFLFFATQVFEGRPVTELVDFIVGSDAIVGADVMSSLAAPSGAPRVVAFQSIELIIRDAGKAAQWAGSATRAWVEISPPGLPSADVVLHIPGVITLAVQCKDKAGVSIDEVRSALNMMSVAARRVVAGDQDEKLQKKDAKRFPEWDNFAVKLAALGAPVVPVLYASRSLFFRDRSDMSSARFDAVGSFCVLAQSIGVASALRPTTASAAGAAEDGTARRWENDVRLHKIRRSVIQFDVRVPVSAPVVVAYADSLPPLADGEVTYTAGGSAHFTERTNALLEKDRKALRESKAAKESTCDADTEQ